MEKEQNKSINIQFCILSALGIIFVVDGHLNNSYLDIGGLLPYYSFHIPLFAFISGYFYRSGSEQDLVRYGKHKFKRLMVPYFLWNLFYGCLAWLLRRHGFTFGEPVTIRNLFVEPFVHGYQFILNHAAWFVPTLFLTELAYGTLQRFLKGWKSGAACLALGAAGIHIAKCTGTEAFWLTLIKVLFLIPLYGAGHLYRTRLEKRDTLGNLQYFSVILGAAMVLAGSGRVLIYAVSNCRDFTGYFLPYITAALGIGFWLRVARILVPAFQNSRTVLFLGRNTYGIMMHHMTVFLMIKAVYAFFASREILFTSFDFNAYRTDFYYCFLPRGLSQLKVFYLLAGLSVPLVFERGIRYLGQRLFPRIGAEISAKLPKKPVDNQRDRC